VDCVEKLGLATLTLLCFNPPGQGGRRPMMGERTVMQEALF
jgi:hypothetical protein